MLGLAGRAGETVARPGTARLIWWLGQLALVRCRRIQIVPCAVWPRDGRLLLPEPLGASGERRVETDRLKWASEQSVQLVSQLVR